MVSTWDMNLKDMTSTQHTDSLWQMIPMILKISVIKECEPLITHQLKQSCLVCVAKETILNLFSVRNRHALKKTVAACAAT